jgi:penicillin amidase
MFMLEIGHGKWIFSKKTVQGRKAEFFGKDHIKSDFFLRLLGLQEKADSIFQEMAPEEQNFYWAYAWGANRGLQKAAEAYEFQKYGYTPDPWLPQDIIAISLLQSFDQTRRTFVTQLEDFARIQTFGEQTEALFDPHGLPWDSSILKEEDFQSPSPNSKPNPLKPKNSRLPTPSAAHTQLDLSYLQPLLGGPDMGSNSWVLAPKRSKTGKAWLANDPPLKTDSSTFLALGAPRCRQNRRDRSFVSGRSFHFFWFQSKNELGTHERFLTHCAGEFCR